MNERIKELAERAGFNNMGIGLIIGIEEYHQKFAELIVKECARIVNENDFEGSIVGDGMLFEHFGVK